MKLQRKLSNLFLALLLTLVSANVFAETKWEVATVFFGSREDAEFQKDIDKNLQEIAKIKPGKSLSIQTFRDSPGKKLSQFLKSAFKDPASRKAIVFYGHGDGSAGLRDFGTVELKKALQESKIQLDVLWFDACFLANLEFLYELRKASKYTIASEEAEFSAGLPFEALSELPQYENPSDASVFLAKRFIESYSYLKNGEQRDYVSVSSATISVVDNSELETFTTAFQKVSALIKKLPTVDQSALKNKLARKYAMDEKSLVDLGHLIIELRLINKDKAIDQELTKLIRLLNIESVKKLQSNPRVRITAPEEGALMIFGFNDWSNGYKSEYVTAEAYKGIIPTKTFLVGPGDKEWPVRKFENKSTVITPFAPGVNSFDYYFLNANADKLLTNSKSITRTHDIVENPISKKADGAFLVYSAYTQQLGNKAERYTGVNITLFGEVPSLDYFELEFNQKTQWLSL